MTAYLFFVNAFFFFFDLVGGFGFASFCVVWSPASSSFLFFALPDEYLCAANSSKYPAYPYSCKDPQAPTRSARCAIVGSQNSSSTENRENGAVIIALNDDNIL